MSGRGWFALGFASPFGLIAAPILFPRPFCWLLGCEPQGAIWSGNNGIEEGRCLHCKRHITRSVPVRYQCGTEQPAGRGDG